MICNCVPDDDGHMLDCPMFLSSLGLVITYDNGIAVVDIVQGEHVDWCRELYCSGCKEIEDEYIERGLDE